MATFFSNLVRNEDTLLEIVVPQSYSLVVFRVRAPPSVKLTPAQLDNLNETYHQAVLDEHKKELAVTETVVPEIGRCIRLAIGSLYTREHHIIHSFERLRKTAVVTRDAWLKENLI